MCLALRSRDCPGLSPTRGRAFRKTVAREASRRYGVRSTLGLLAEELGRRGRADGRALHEAVAREAARRVDAVADPADDRVRVRRHVVEARPGVGDRRLRRRWIAMTEAREPVVEHRLVDALLEPPARGRRRSSRARAGRPDGGSGSRSRPRPPSAGRPEARAARCGAAGGTSGRTGSSTPRAAATSADHGPQAITSASAVERERVGALAQLHPARDRAPHELAGDRRRIGAPVLPTGDGADHVVGAQTGDARGVDALGGNAELDLDARGVPPAPPARPRSSRRTGSRPARRTDGRATRRRGSSSARAAPRPPSRTAGAHRPSPSQSPRRDLAGIGEHDVLRSALARGGTRSTRRSRPRPATTTRATGRAPPARRSGSARSGRARPRGSERRGARARASPRRGTESAPAPSRSRRLRPSRRARPRPPRRETPSRAPTTTRRARAQSLLDQRLGADEDVESLEQVRRERVPRPVETFSPRRFGACSRRRSTTPTGTA